MCGKARTPIGTGARVMTWTHGRKPILTSLPDVARLKAHPRRLPGFACFPCLYACAVRFRSWSGTRSRFGQAWRRSDTCRESSGSPGRCESVLWHPDMEKRLNHRFKGRNSHIALCCTPSVPPRLARSTAVFTLATPTTVVLAVVHALWRCSFFGGIDCSKFKGWSTRLDKPSRFN